LQERGVGFGFPGVAARRDNGLTERANVLAGIALLGAERTPRRQRYSIRLTQTPYLRQLNGSSIFHPTMEGPMTDTAFQDRFIAFIDVMGFKDMIEQAEQGEGRSVDEIREILETLANHKSKSFFQKHGPQLCPCSPRIDNHLAFEITQVSDCAIVSVVE
jgi:hypothetical protein